MLPAGGDWHERHACSSMPSKFVLVDIEDVGGRRWHLQSPSVVVAGRRVESERGLIGIITLSVDNGRDAQHWLPVGLGARAHLVHHHSVADVHTVTVDTQRMIVTRRPAVSLWIINR